MTDLFLIFLSGAMFENLALAFYADPGANHHVDAKPWLLATSSVLVAAVAAWALPPHAWAPPPGGIAFADALAFVSVGMATPSASLTRLAAGVTASADQRVRRLLPLVVGTLGTVVFALVDARRVHPFAQTLWFCITAAAAMFLVGQLFESLRRGVAGSSLSRAGTPATILAALALALVGAGLARWMP